MKLINQFTLWYLAITTLVLVIGSVIIFRSVAHEIDKEQAFDLRDWIENTASRIEKGHSMGKLNRTPVEIRELDISSPLRPFEVRDTLAMHEQQQRPVRQLKASQSFRIGGRHYYISVYNTMVEPDDIVEALAKSLSWIFLMLLVVVVLTDRLVSKKILLPFQKTLQTIRAFNLKQREPIRLGKTATREFTDLNLFLEKMTEKAVGDYLALKEFTENASHELQTPLAIIRGKLELLLESKLEPSQAANITAALEAVEKLSRTGKSLTLLTKLENREYEAGTPIDLSAAVEHCIGSLEELIELKHLRLEKNIEQNVKLKLHPVLADILLGNLLSNAIRHNISEGFIRLRLDKHKLVIENSGAAPDQPAEQLFGRFKKGSQRADSVGLGLAIARQVCELNDIGISYTYEEGVHLVRLYFPSGKV